MKTYWFGILIALLSLAEPVRAQETALNLSIAVPAIDPGNDRDIVAFDHNSHFAVILTNTSKQPQRIVTDWNSWGDHALSFEITDQSGKKSIARRVSQVYSKNALHWWILQPQESMVMDVYFADPQIWEGFPHPGQYGASETVTLRAIFELNLESRKPLNDLWTGRVVSKPEQVVFSNRISEKK